MTRVENLDSFSDVRLFPGLVAEMLGVDEMSLRENLCLYLQQPWDLELSVGAASEYFIA